MKRFFLTPILCAVGSLLAFASIGNAQNLIGNGDFTSPGPGPDNIVATLPAAPNFVTGWTALPGDGANSNVYYYGANANQYIPNPSVGNALWLDGSVGFGEQRFTQGTGISLASPITLDAGTYNLSCLINTEVGPGKGGTSGILTTLTAAGLTGGSLTFENSVTQPFDVTSADASASWKPISIQFTLASSSEFGLTFRDDPNALYDNQNLSSNVSLENVSLTPIPEPTSLSLIALGAVSLVGFQAWRRRRPVIS